jgi:hypothetical protein
MHIQLCLCLICKAEFQQVTLKVLRWEERDKRLVIKDGELVTWGTPVFRLMVSSQLAESLARVRENFQRDGTSTQAESKPSFAEWRLRSLVTINLTVKFWKVWTILQRPCVIMIKNHARDDQHGGDRGSQQQH